MSARQPLALVAVLMLADGCARDPGDGEGWAGGEAGVIPPCSTAEIECPTSDPVPTYSADVAPLLEQRCTGCHGPGGENQDVPLTTYRAVSRNATAISDVLGCKMPPPPLPRLTDAERKVLVCWYSRGKPQ